MFAFAWVVSCATAGVEDVGVPSGMDLLYSDRVVFEKSGEPVVAIGLMEGQTTTRFRGTGVLHLDFYEDGVLKRTTVPAGKVVSVHRMRAQPARRRYGLDVGGIPLRRRRTLATAMAGWRRRGFARVEVIEQGALLGIGGEVLDTREYRLVVPTPNRTQAQRLKTQLYERFGERGTLTHRLLERPWAELQIRAGGRLLGRATSFVRFTAAAKDPIEVLQVEHGRGYAWHGRTDRKYSGELYAVVDPEGLLAVTNVVGVETLLGGVVPAEIFASAHPQALRAQAVAARTTLLAKLGQRHHGDPFHLCAEQHCQVYTGINQEDPRTRRAVNATFGEVLFFGEQLVDAVYSSNCGGHTEDNDVVWGDRPNPALRGVPDFDLPPPPRMKPFTHGNLAPVMRSWVQASPQAYCARASKAQPERFRWLRHFDTNTLRQIVNNHAPKLGPLRDIRVEQRGRGGRVVSLRLMSDRNSVVVMRELPIRRLFQNLNSGAFVVLPEHDAHGHLRHVTFQGAGWGHGVGMCQLGAIGRAEAGHGYTDILAHYYNGARIRPLYRGPLATRRQAFHAPTLRLASPQR